MQNQSFSHLMHIFDNDTLVEQGYMHNTLPGKPWDGTGKVNLYFDYPEIREVRQRKSHKMDFKSEQWTDTFLIDTHDSAEASVESFRVLLSRYAKRKGWGTGSTRGGAGK
eukprot:GDKI01019514.1.p2 GENE.GDKI01019514.1~~GDKI01019514.1.p2  ORF type:complete len:110 (-),score=18.12 GDKI01019514.1:86-415(-)